MGLQEKEKELQTKLTLLMNTLDNEWAFVACLVIFHGLLVGVEKLGVDDSFVLVLALAPVGQRDYLYI